MIQTVKLAKLRLSPINVRTAPEKDLAIEPMAADIEARGVLQNLLVTPARPRGTFEVFDGGRRLRGLLLLAERGTIDADSFDVPVLVLKDSDAALSETSLAANFHQLKLLGHVSRVSFDRKDYRAVCLFQAARSAYPKSWRRAAWNKHLRGGCGILRCGISVASPSRGRLVDLLARLSAQHI